MGKVIVITGPTASGKTSASIKLAQELNGEIISADSMQVYRYMDIGTAKPDEQERAGIRHYLIDEVNPDEEFNVVKFKTLAENYIKVILSKGKVPVVVGGTGLYIDSLLQNITFSETESDPELREKLYVLAAEKGNRFLHDMLRNIDPQAADKIHENNVKRVIRAIEVYENTNKTITQHKELSRQTPPEHDYIVFGLDMNRERLYERINLRVDLMLEKGLVTEVQKLVHMGYDKGTTAMQAIGYKEILEYLNKNVSLETAVETIKKGTRNYAKRQLTWFRRNPDIHWIDTDKYEGEYDILGKMKDFIASVGFFL